MEEDGTNLVDEGLGHEGIKKIGEFFSKIAKKLPNYTRIEGKKRETKVSPALFFGSKNDNFLTLDDTLQFVSLPPIGSWLKFIVLKRRQAYVPAS